MGLNRSSLIAIALAGAVAAWMLTGVERGAGSPAPDTAAVDELASAVPRLRVSVRPSQAQTVAREIVINGHTEPNRTIELRAETEGPVVALGAERGSAVAAGEKIARLAPRDRESRLAEARAVIAQYELQSEAARKLQQDSLISGVQLAEAEARLAGARATLKQIEIDLENTRLKAPFDAVVQERHVELGDFVKVGDAIARLVDTDPLLVVGEVSERDIGKLSIGARGHARLVSGEQVEGSIRYVAPVADEATRTFRVELAIPNADHALRAGITAEVRVTSREVTAHFLSPALLTLDATGTVGIKSVDEHGFVRFHPVEVVNSSNEGIWVSGLPAEIRVITIGQGFVTPGQAVEAIPEDPEGA